ncbi:MAG: zinc ribbon domain-containing protein [Desulfobulbaceae bacterium]|nr:zinc ribbon domain-containing protein [Desulfobulbaceae bacterium]
MPVYEYECPQCEKVHEVQQKMTDKPLSTCPECGGEVKKLISVSSFQLKGGGWYADGYSGISEKKGKEKTTTSTGSPSTPPCKGGKAPCASCPASATAS